MPEITTIRESLYWCYANLAMAHAAVTQQTPIYNRTHFMIRSRLYKGLIDQTMAMGSIADDERLKMILPQACHYCGKSEKLSIDHLIPTAHGGQDRAENFVWACQSCNSAKRDTDMLDWYRMRGEFPPLLLLLRRYLKVVIEICAKGNMFDTELGNAPPLPFSLHSIPHNFPKPSESRCKELNYEVDWGV